MLYKDESGNTWELFEFAELDKTAQERVWRNFDYQNSSAEWEEEQLYNDISNAWEWFETNASNASISYKHLITSGVNTLEPNWYHEDGLENGCLIDFYELEFKWGYGYDCEILASDIANAWNTHVERIQATNKKLEHLLDLEFYHKNVDNKINAWQEARNEAIHNALQAVCDVLNSYEHDCLEWIYSLENLSEIHYTSDEEYLYDSEGHCIAVEGFGECYFIGNPLETLEPCQVLAS